MTSNGVRTAAIVVGLALIVWLVPGGGDGGAAVGATLSALFLGAIVLLGIRAYRETRGRIEILGDAHRLLLYGAIGMIVVAMAARPRLVETGAGTVLWLVLVGSAVAMLFAVYQRWRDVV
ncbi:hypothetical protein [Patulibacter defluvii]|uniref:hypothetical protein n=1 Tax=Patulibacter defluvii TaxID=3095358 RepID=UPI002A75FEAD|nr:hypothetical protein [Patulibacter sp. DM4]